MENSGKKTGSDLWQHYRIDVPLQAVGGVDL